MAAVAAVAEVVALRRAVAGDSTAAGLTATVADLTAGSTVADTPADIAVDTTAEAQGLTRVVDRLARALATVVPVRVTRGRGKGTAPAMLPLAGMGSPQAMGPARAGALADPWPRARVNPLAQEPAACPLMRQAIPGDGARGRVWEGVGVGGVPDGGARVGLPGARSGHGRLITTLLGLTIRGCLPTLLLPLRTWCIRTQRRTRLSRLL